MNPNELAVTFTSGQLAVLLVVACLLLIALGKWAVRQFQKDVEAGFKRMDGQFVEIKKDMASRPTRIEMENHVRDIHRRIDDHVVAMPRRRNTDETLPGLSA